MTQTTAQRAPITVKTLQQMKQRGEKFACLTAYDAAFARVLDDAGVDVILVGDSLGMVIQGEHTTVPVSMNDMIYHACCVSRLQPAAMIMVDLPFMSYRNIDLALTNAARLMQEGGAQIVKLEGGQTQVPIVKALTEQGIPVCAHLGLTPQSVHKLGGYRVQGRQQSEAEAMLLDAEALQAAGADMILLECVPATLAAEITSNVNVPVIGIGAGSQTDAQVLVLQDVLGITPGQPPRFSKDFMYGSHSIQEAIEHYVHAVKEGSFPAGEQIIA